VSLVGVLQEKRGAADFQPFLSGPLYYDHEKIFFGPKQEPIGSGWDRRGVWRHFKGDRFLPGGVFVIGPRNEGVVFHHKKEVWGNPCNTTALLEAVRKLSYNKSERDL